MHLLLEFRNIKFENLDVIRYKHNDKIDEIDSKLTEQQSKKIWNSTEVKFNIYLNNDIQKVISTALSNTTELVNIADFTLGITPYDKYRGHTEEQIKNRVVAISN